MIRRLFLSLLCLVIASCSDREAGEPPPEEGKPAPVTAVSGQAPSATLPTGSPGSPAIPQTSGTSGRYRILDSFEVGEDVYVRSLFTDESEKALWIGTSVGVLEIDVESREVRRTLTRQEGLANEYVFAIGRDAGGGIVFGTNAGGMSRLKDGKWKTYFPMHGLADYWVYSFLSHPDGGLWIGTWAGVNRLDLKSDRFTTYVKELVNEWVYAMALDSHQRIWFGTEGGISRFDGKEWRSWTHEDGLGASNGDNLPASPNTGLGTRRRHDLGVLSNGAPTYNPNYVFSLVMEPGDILWAGTWGGGVSRFDGEKWTSFTNREGLPGNIVYSLVRDRDGVIWAGTNNGLGLFHQGKWRPFDGNLAMTGQNIYTLAVTPDGTLWAGARGRVFHIGQ
ncbi:MAG: regulator [Magnetococcales bacterium]|nr:regulator [Magnetococcales bacterium]MBF0156292.1 regulator [Magnetococcales bacterium]